MQDCSSWFLPTIKAHHGEHLGTITVPHIRFLVFSLLFIITHLTSFYPVFTI